MESTPTPPKRSRAGLGILAVLFVAVLAITVVRLRHADQPTPSGAADGTLTLERSACQGACPAFTLTLDTDGTVTWEGRTHVGTKGTATKHVDPKLAQGVYVRALGAMSNMHDEYTCEVPDQDRAALRFHSRSTQGAGQITASPACPNERCSGSKAFCELAKTLESSVGAAAWIECKDAAGAPSPCPSEPR